MITSALLDRGATSIRHKNEIFLYVSTLSAYNKTMFLCSWEQISYFLVLDHTQNERIKEPSIIK